MRELLRRYYQWHFRKTAGVSPSTELGRSAIVFAPHPDDEVLGCGGTILRKRNIGANVKIVFMTDGSESHSGFIDPQRLATIRTDEAIAAAKVLDVSSEDLYFFNIKDGKLSEYENLENSSQKVFDLLLKFSPEELYIPYRYEPHIDHVATNVAVLQALRRWGHPVMVYEYPVWFLRCWPLVKFEAKGFKATIKKLKSTLRFNLRLMLDFRCAISIVDTVELKKTALAQYVSQTIKPEGNREWAVLADASDGEFIRCFFWDREIYYKHLER